ncbi:DUF58 domain-containing protein [Helcobacillus massiliensis]|uniref:DUF58 domain-containing protein n=1 Tax=Helcobacillus massiliensis TaxID=521392 RepID=UPI0025571943|nr:DUF58 domain-containing protein [Helcobacillus massiliensis]MDK7742085.1 DUF58 domain-containing protein [Helcobacillus massiliensis]WOO93640.1 DUF58 domain-containing protein [Helcobacillus massiliensis]
MSQSLLTRVQARVDLHTSRKVRGLITGRGTSLFTGHGEDFDDLKAYQPGDRISDIDWKATARSGEPLIRRFTEQRIRHIAIIADTSQSMSATAADGTDKLEAMLLAAGLVCFAARQHADQVGLVAGTADAPETLPMRSSDAHLELLLRTVQRATTAQAGEGDDRWLLERAHRWIRRPSLLLFITDEARPSPDLEADMRLLARRHDLLVLRIRDADPLQPDRLTHSVEDTDADHDLLDYTRRDPAVRRAVQRYREAREQQVTAMLDGLHIAHALTDGADSVVDDMIRLLRAPRRPHGRR